MPEIVAAEIEQYALDHTSPSSELLSEVAERTRNEFPDRSGMMVGALEGRFLEALVFGMGARRILEIGAFTGYSSLSMAAGMPRDGRIITCELSPEHAALARHHIAASAYADRIEIREGPALETIAYARRPLRPRVHRCRQGLLSRLLRGDAAEARAVEACWPWTTHSSAGSWSTRATSLLTRSQSGVSTTMSETIRASSVCW